MRSSVQQIAVHGNCRAFEMVREESVVRSIMVAMAFAAAFIVCMGSDPVRASSDTDGVVIGAIDIHTGETYLREDILRRQFKDGGDIEAFVVRPLTDGYNLLRIGYDAKGNCRTEALPLRVVGNKLVFEE